MPIVSISLNDEILENMDKIQKDLGFSGRSEVIRAGVRMLIADSKEKEELIGETRAILLLTRDKKAESVTSRIKHKFVNITKTQIIDHVREDKFLEIFVLDGDADAIKEMYRQFITSRKMEYIKLIIA